MLDVLDLFSGIGGFSLGLERAGMRTVAFCEIEPYCQAVLREHWPDVPVFGDVRSLTAEVLADAKGEFGRRRSSGASSCSAAGQPQSCGKIELICGGFPCQDISVAGKGAGITGERSGLWSEYARIIGEVRPRYIIVENVAALLGRGIERVLGDLAALGYDAEWHCIPASAVGAPHRRDRVWIIANSEGTGLPRGQRQECAGRSKSDRCHSSASNTNGTGLEVGEGQDASRARTISWPIVERNEWWLIEPNVGRMAHGVPARVDRLRSLGNAIVPQIAEIIGRAIVNDYVDSAHK